MSTSRPIHGSTSCPKIAHNGQQQQAIGHGWTHPSRQSCRNRAYPCVLSEIEGGGSFHDGITSYQSVGIPPQTHTMTSQITSNKAFGGYIRKFKAESRTLGLPTQFNVFVPSSSSQSTTFPVLYYLAGLTCNEDTGPWKGGFLAHANACGIALVFPDTSPRGANVEGEEDNWDLGTGAGFYLDATADKWAKNYRMFSFVTEDLVGLLKGLNLPLDLSRQSIMGHSMGGLGALNLFLSTSQYRSASAFSPACNPTRSPWGTKAFSSYLKGGIEEGEKYDPSCLLGKARGRIGVNILVDYGDADQFYKDGQLLPETLQQAAENAGFSHDSVKVRQQEGYDHSYYFVSTFAEEHIKFHANFLKA